MSNPTAANESRRPDPTRRARTIAIVVVMFACLPIVVATVRALLHHWTPIGDDGLLAIRAQDLFSRHIPLLGTASSASFAATKPLNNPGPLYFYLLGVPVGAFGSAVGTAVGAAAVNLAVRKSSSGAPILLLNPDLVLTGEVLSGLLDALASPDGPDGVAPLLIEPGNRAGH